MFWKLLGDLSFVSRCRKYNIGLWQCPNFLFLVMGFLTVAAMLGTYFVAKSFDNETVTIVSVTLVAGIIIIIASFVIRGVERIAEANIMKSEFISIVSHQLCGPLSAIKWNLEVLETEKVSGSYKLSPKQQVFLGNIGKANEQMLKLVNDLMEVVRIEQGKADFQKTKLDLRGLAEEVVSDLSRLAEVKKIAVDVEGDENLSLVEADRKKMKDVFTNLMSNAITYSHDGGKVKVTFKNEGKKVIVSIQDWGVGIPRFQHRRVFEKFFRSRNESRYRTEGIGLGLYLVRAALANFGGEIWFQSEVDKGSTFFFSLPQATT